MQDPLATAPATAAEGARAGFQGLSHRRAAGMAVMPSCRDAKKKSLPDPEEEEEETRKKQDRVGWKQKKRGSGSWGLHVPRGPGLALECTPSTRFGRRGRCVCWDTCSFDVLRPMVVVM